MDNDTERRHRYRRIADLLRAEITSGRLGAGSLLPSESELGVANDASRVTVRRALELLRDEGLVASRQGFGWFVARPPLRQELARLDPLEDQLAAAGLTSERRVLSFGFVATPAHVREHLDGRQCLRVIRLHLADDSPMALVTVWCREDLGARLSRADVERSTLLDQLGARVGGAGQTIRGCGDGRRGPSARGGATIAAAGGRPRHPFDDR
ncbi:MAG: GntR family transcriptional regulator [Microthrixaceae bacterium]